MIIRECTDIEELRPLAAEWLTELNAVDFDLDVNIEIIKADLEKWLSSDGITLVAEENDTIIGMISVFAADSYLGEQKIALEKYWYCSSGGHFAGPKLYLTAIEWSRQHGCSHMITCGNRMASDRHDAICQFLEHTGAKHFETSYIFKL